MSFTELLKGFAIQLYAMSIIRVNYQLKKVISVTNVAQG